MSSVVQKPPRHSAIYEGTVHHRRRLPASNAFTYPLFMMYLDLDELPELFDDHWLWSTRRAAPACFRRRDYFGPADQPLAETVRELVQERTGQRPAGPIRMLTHLRYFGHQINPVTFYYCFAANSDAVEVIVAEVTNTPWGERHCYVLSTPEPSAAEAVRRYRLNKDFHVSPFMRMDLEYDWRFTVPGKRLVVQMNSLRQDEHLFGAVLSLERHEISHRSLSRALARYPLITVRVALWIYWQALKLWFKKVPFHTHPKKNIPAGEQM